MGSVCNSRQCGESFSIHCHMKMLKKDFIVQLMRGSGKDRLGMALKAKGLKA